MHIAKQIIWGMKLELDYDENPTFRHFEKACGQRIPLDVLFFTNYAMCMLQLTMCCNKTCNPHLELVAIISIIGSADRSAHIKLH